MSLITACPDTPPGPAVAALNAIFDIYGDGEFAYDAPVFVKNNFVGHLQTALPKVRTMVSWAITNKINLYMRIEC